MGIGFKAFMFVVIFWKTIVGLLLIVIGLLMVAIAKQLQKKEDKK